MKRILLSLLLLSGGANIPYILYNNSGGSLHAQRPTDLLDRGLVAVPANTNGGSGSGNFVSWRIFGEEYYDVTYNLYANGSLLKEGLTVSCFSHAAGTATTVYQVAAVVKGVEQAKSREVTRWNSGYLDIPVATVTDREGNDVTSQYILNDVSLGDVDGDGVVEFLVKRNYTGSDLNTTDNTTRFHHYECYRLDGTRLWWIDLGPNMMAGPDEQWDIVLFDWDQDGKAEGIMRGADNMIIHTAGGGVVEVGDMSYVAPRHQYTCEGNEYLLYLNGSTGEPYNIGSDASKPWMTYPLPRYESGETDYTTAWGKSSGGGHDGGHRSSKHYFGAPFLDGRHPSIFLGRGCYTRHKMVAYDVDPATHQLIERWRWSNNGGWSDPWFGNGYHNFGIADVDWDGRDEIVFGSMVIDDNGRGLSTTGLGHGDAQHCRDFDPYRHGQEIFACNEDEPAMNYRNATTSAIYYRAKTTSDDGRALCGNFTNAYPGCLGRSTQTGYVSTVADRLFPDEAPGDAITQKNYALVWSHLNFRIFWDGDLLDEVLDSPGTEREACIYKFPEGRVFTTEGCKLNNDSKNNPCAQGDIFGDWREEIVVRTSDNTKLRIYTTGIPTTYRIPTLWHDHQYRNAMVWQPIGYNQPPHVSFFLGKLEDITIAPPPLTLTDRTEVKDGGVISADCNGRHVIVCETNDSRVSIEDGASPAVVTFNVPSWVQGTGSNKTDGSADILRTYFTCTAEGGALTGSTRLVKQGDGILSLPEVDLTHTGATDVWAGTLDFNGSMRQSTLWLNRFAQLNSNGTFRCIKADYAAVIRPGGKDHQGSLTTDSLMLGFGARLQLDAYSKGFQADGLNIKLLSIEKKTGTAWETYGPAYLTPVLELVVHPTDGDDKLAAGRYLIGDLETVKGSLSDIKIEGASKQKVSLLQEDGKLYLVVEGIRDASTVYWTGEASTTWDFASTENFRNEEDEPDIFVSGDKVIFDDSAKKFTVSLAGDFVADTVEVNNSRAYVFTGTGSLTGPTALVKRGKGTLTIANDNTYSGPTIISGGTVKVSALSNENRDYGNLGSPSASTKNFIIENGATLQTTAAVQMGSPILLQGDEGGILNNSADFAMDRTFLGTTLTKKGSGGLICYQTNGSLSSLVIQGGYVAERNGNAAKAIEFQGGTLYDDSQSTSHDIYVAKGKTGTWYLTDTYYTAYANKLTGEGTLTIIPRNKVSRVRITGDWSKFEGTIKHTTTDIWLPLDATSGIPNGTLNIASGCTVTNVCKAFTIGCLTGSGALAQPVSNFQNKNAVAGNNTWNVGNSSGKDFSFAGQLTDNGSTNKLLFNKIGSCKMTFTGSGDFGGACRVNGGELCLNSSRSDIMLGTSSLNVSSGATLSGKGTLGNSAVTIAAGGTIRSGITETNAQGNLNLGGATLTVNGNAQLFVSSSSAYGKFTGIGKLRLNGTLTVRGSDELALSEGDELHIFDATSITLGSNLRLDLCQPNAELPLKWDTSRLSEGVITVVSDPDALLAPKAAGNGQDAIHTLSGIKLQQRPSKGIFIVDGKKVQQKR